MASPVMGGPALSRSTHAELTEVQRLMEADANRQAVHRLEALGKRVQSSPYELAVVRQYLGYALVSLERFREACVAVEEAVRPSVLPPDVQHRLHYLLAQLYVQTEEPVRARRYLEKWLQEETAPKPHAHALAARVYHALGHRKAAMRHLQAAISAAEQPDESWFLLLAYIYIDGQRLSAAEVLLREAISIYPASASAWHYLVNVYLSLGREHKALSTLMLAYREGLLEPSELTRSAQLYAGLGVPEKAARLLAQWRHDGRLGRTGEHTRLEARLWMMARERGKAIALLQGKELTGDGESLLLLGHLLLEEQRWKEAAQALQDAVRAGDLKELERAQLLLGVAAFRAGNSQLATTALQQVRDDEVLAEKAAFWLRLLAEPG